MNTESDWLDNFSKEMAITAQHSASKATLIWLNNNVITPLELENSHLKLVIGAAEQKIEDLKAVINKFKNPVN